MARGLDALKVNQTSFIQNLHNLKVSGALQGVGLTYLYGFARGLGRWLGSLQREPEGPILGLSNLTGLGRHANPG